MMLTQNVIMNSSILVPMLLVERSALSTKLPSMKCVKMLLNGSAAFCLCVCQYWTFAECVVLAMGPTCNRVPWNRLVGGHAALAMVSLPGSRLGGRAQGNSLSIA